MNLTEATKLAQAEGTTLRTQVKQRIRKTVRILYAICLLLLELVWVWVYQPWIFGRGIVPSFGEMTIIFGVIALVPLLIAVAFILAPSEEEKK